MKTSKLFTEITNTSWIATRLKPEFSHNPEHFPPCYCQKVDQGLNSLMFQLSCLSQKSVKYSFDITLLEWKAQLLLHDFWTTALFLKLGARTLQYSEHFWNILVCLTFTWTHNLNWIYIRRTYVVCSLGILHLHVFFIRTSKLEKAMQCS